MNKTYTCSTIDECLEQASKELGIPKHSLDYSIEEETKLFFRKSCTISVKIEEETKEDVLSGSASIKDGKIIVKNPCEGKRAAIIRASMDVRLVIDDKEVVNSVEIYENSKIEYFFSETKSERLMNIRISDNRMEAYLDIKYIPEIVFKLKDTKETNTLILESDIKEKKYPPRFGKDEIKEELKKHGIINGVIEENVNECIKKDEINNLVIAKGQPMQDDEDDVVELKFAMDNDLKKLSEDNNGRVDFKSIGSINAVLQGDVVARLIKGKEGTDGKDVFGNIKKHKAGKKINLTAGQGCILKDNTTVIAAIQGKPCIKNNTCYVFQLHEVSKDVDMSTGNIKFVGDVLVNGTVREGMKVEAGNAANIKGNVERAEIIAKGDINIDGNIIFSSVNAGGEDNEKLNFLKTLEGFSILLKALIDNIEEIKKFNLLGYDKTDGQIIKVLMDTKFKTLSKICLNLLAQSALINHQEGRKNDSLTEAIRGQLMGLAPLKIKHYSELFGIIDILKNKIEIYKNTLALPVNIKIGYCQDSSIKSSGNIMVVGKGTYVSNLEAHQGIYFLTEGSVVRGGSLRASTEIKCKVVGSQGGVTTRLIVDDGGQIWMDTAYENTIVGIGMREQAIDVPSKNVHAFLDTNGDLIVERLNL